MLLKEEEKIKPQLQVPEPVRVDFVDKMEEYFGAYAMKVLLDRAVPDIGDGCKIVERRILWAMYGMKFFYTEPVRKCARIVGEVMAKLHPHSDDCIYKTVTRLSHKFVTHYPLLEGQGHMGDEDNEPAAQRYTGARLSKIATNFIVADLDHNVADFKSTYDASGFEPEVIPAKLPMLWIRGSYGIAVAARTAIPPHNLVEVCKAIIYCIGLPENDLKNPAKTPEIVDHLMKECITGPDFPTGGAISKEDIRQFYITGSANLHIVLNHTFDVKKNIVTITSIPYLMSRKSVIKSIAQAAVNGHIDVKDIVDRSTAESYLIDVYLGPCAEYTTFMKQLETHTCVRYTFNCKALALYKGVPTVLSFPQYAQAFIDFRINCIVKKLQNMLRDVYAKAESLFGILAVFTVSEKAKKVLEIVQSSDKEESCVLALKAMTFNITHLEHFIFFPFTDLENYRLSKKQISDILSMKVRVLMKYQTEQIKATLLKLKKFVQETEEILLSPEKIRLEIVKELQQGIEEFKQPRTCVVVGAAERKQHQDIDLGNYNDQYIIAVDQDGNFHVHKFESKAQHRGGVGRRIFKKEIMFAATARPDSVVVIVSSLGRIFLIHIFSIINSSKKGIFDHRHLKQGETVVFMTTMKEKIDADEFLFIITKEGILKKVKASNLLGIKKAGKKILSSQSDKIVKVLASKSNRLFIASNTGRILCIDTKDAKEFKTLSAKGVRGMKLKGEEIVDMISVDSEDLIKEDSKIFLITNENIGKFISTAYFIKERDRNTRGIASVKSGTSLFKIHHHLAGKESINLITGLGRLLTINVDELPTLKRSAKGVSVIDLKDSENISDRIIEVF